MFKHLSNNSEASRCTSINFHAVQKIWVIYSNAKIGIMLTGSELAIE